MSMDIRSHEASLYPRPILHSTGDLQQTMHLSATTTAVRVAALLGAFAVPSFGASQKRDCATYNGYIYLGDAGYLSPPVDITPVASPNIFVTVNDSSSAGVYQFSDCGEPAFEIVYAVRCLCSDFDGPQWLTILADVSVRYWE